MSTSSIAACWLVCFVTLALIVPNPAAAPLPQEESSAEEQSDTEKESSASSEGSASSNSTEDQERERSAVGTAGTRRVTTLERMAAEEATRIKAPSNQNVSPLVKAAQSSSDARSVKKYTDADLKKVKGHMIVIEGTNVREPEIKPVEERTPEELRSRQPDHEAQAREIRRKNEISRLQKEIASIESDLRRLETDYYNIEEEDQDEVIERQFSEKQRALEEAKKKLSELQGSGGG